MFASDGGFAGTVSIVLNITQRKKAEEELREYVGRYRDLFESTQDHVSIYVGKEGRLVDHNAAFKRLFGRCLHLPGSTPATRT